MLSCSFLINYSRGLINDDNCYFNLLQFLYYFVVLEELRRMQEKICLLEAKLSKQQKADEAPQEAASSSTVAFSPASHHLTNALSQSNSLHKPLSDKTSSSLNTKQGQDIATVKLANGSEPKTPKQDTKKGISKSFLYLYCKVFF